MTDLQKNAAALLPADCIKFDELLSRHTTFRIGGPAEVMVFPESREMLRDALNLSKISDCKWYILGAGSNVLAPDEGVKGLVICLKDKFQGIDIIHPNVIRVLAGSTMTQAAVFAADHSLSGLEFAHGIPGSVGGGVYMNAGAYGGEIQNVCTRVEVLRQDGSIFCYTGEEMGFSYRHSRLEEEGGIVISADFSLKEGDRESIRQTMRELMNRRKNSQPLDLPSAGSAFKRPVGGYAAALIDNAGLKGYRVGGCGVSEKHAGFVVNLGAATARDVRQLLCDVSNVVYRKSGIRLEPEVRIW